MKDIQVTIDSFKKFTGNIFMIDNIPEISVFGDINGNCEFENNLQYETTLTAGTLSDPIDSWDVYLTSVFIGGYKMEQFAQPGCLFDNTYRWDGTGADVVNGPSQHKNALGIIDLQTSVSGARLVDESFNLAAALSAAQSAFAVASAASQSANADRAAAEATRADSQATANSLANAATTARNAAVTWLNAIQRLGPPVGDLGGWNSFQIRYDAYQKALDLEAAADALDIQAATAAATALTHTLTRDHHDIFLVPIANQALTAAQVTLSAATSAAAAVQQNAVGDLSGIDLEVFLARGRATQSLLYSGGAEPTSQRIGGYVGIDASGGGFNGLTTHNSQPIFTNESIQAFVIHINDTLGSYMPNDSFIGGRPLTYKTWPDASGNVSDDVTWDNPDTVNYGGNMLGNGKGNPLDITGGIVLMNNPKQRNDGFLVSGYQIDASNQAESLVNASGVAGQLTVQDYVPFIYDERENNPIYLTTLKSGSKISKLNVKITDQNGNSIWGPAHVSQMKNSNGIDANPPTASRRIIIKLTYKPVFKDKLIDKLDQLNSNIEKLIVLNNPTNANNPTNVEPPSDYNYTNSYNPTNAISPSDTRYRVSIG